MIRRRDWLVRNSLIKQLEANKILAEEINRLHEIWSLENIFAVQGRVYVMQIVIKVARDNSDNIGGRNVSANDKRKNQENPRHVRSGEIKDTKKIHNHKRITPSPDVDNHESERGAEKWDLGKGGYYLGMRKNEKYDHDKGAQ